MSVLLIIKLKKIIYSGENIGNDLSFQFDVQGQITHVKTGISFGQHKSFDKVLFQETFTDGSVSLPISVNITEKDTIHDTGSGSSSFNVQLQETEPQTHSFNANVIASGGDKGKTATFTFIMEADVEDTINIDLVSPTSNQQFHIQMAGPSMPTVQLHAAVSPETSDLEYRFQVGSRQTGRALEYEDTPTSGYAHPSIIDSGWLSTNKWTIDFDTNLYGGHVTHVTVLVRKDGKIVCSSLIQRDFYIIGDALTSQMRNSYIDTLTNYDANIRTMAKAIALQESGGTHFWTEGQPGSASHDRYPLRESGGGGGYGVMQLTDPSLLSRDTIWNWKENITAAMDYIERMYNLGVAHLNAHTNGVTDRMRRLEGYNRYNGGPTDRYHWWSTGPANHNGVPEGWTKFGYIICGTGGADGYRDYNNDGVADAAGNPYNIPNGPTGGNNCVGRAARYADNAILNE